MTSSANLGPDFGEAGLTDCDREPIQIPGAVQAHGVLLVLSEPDLFIIQATVNMRRVLELAAEHMLGQSLSLLLDTSAMAALKSVLGEPLTEPRYLPPFITNVGLRMEASIHRTPAGLLLELEPYIADQDFNMPQLFRRLLSAVYQAPTVEMASSMATRDLRAITGFDRAMLYRMLPDGSGQIIAEDRRDDLESYLGMHYPASDIPQQARRLFVLNPLRVWATTQDNRAALTPLLNPTTNAPLDMSRCGLRAASPIHTEYLRNMGVGACMSLSIVRDDKLWGMISLHHETARRVPHTQRVVLESLGRLLAILIETKERETHAAEEARLQAWNIGTLAALGAAGGSVSALRERGDALLQFTSASGAAVHISGHTATFGDAPPAASVAELAQRLGSFKPGEIIASHQTSADLAEVIVGIADLPRGLLAIPVSRRPGDYLMWFRPEVVQTFNWAGNPNKAMVIGPFGGRLTPRGSFALWAETVAGQAEPWSTVSLEALQLLHVALMRYDPPAIEGNAMPQDQWQPQGGQFAELERRVAEAVEAARDANGRLHQLVAALDALAEGLWRD